MEDDSVEVYLSVVRERSADFAHDLKTPLNIVVLNAELLRMRIEKLVDDEKSHEYAASIEKETRRIAAIIDGFMNLLAVPPGAGHSTPLATLTASLSDGGIEIGDEPRTLTISAEAAAMIGKLLATGLPDLFARSSIETRVEVADDDLMIMFAGEACRGVEIGKVFKFYYTDASGSSSVEMAAARILAEMIGGSLELNDEAEPRLVLTLSLPLTRNTRNDDE